MRYDPDSYPPQSIVDGIHDSAARAELTILRETVESAQYVAGLAIERLNEAQDALRELHAEAHGDPCVHVRCWVTTALCSEVRHG